MKAFLKYIVILFPKVNQVTCDKRFITFAEKTLDKFSIIYKDKYAYLKP